MYFAIDTTFSICFQKCRQRMRERRSQLFNRSRFGLQLDSTHMQDALTEIIRQEFKNLATSNDGGASLTFKEIDEPLSQEEALELENEIVHEQGLINIYISVICDNIIISNLLLVIIKLAESV